MAPPTSWNCQIFVFKTTPSEKNYQNRLVPLPKEQLRISKAKFVTGINLPKLRCENIFPTLKIRKKTILRRNGSFYTVYGGQKKKTVS